MTNPTDNAGSIPSTSELKTQAKKGLREFFQQPSIRKLVDVLVPSALAAVLLPIFGPAVAGAAASVAIENGLRLLGISFSAETIGKLLKPFEGRKLEEADIQAVLQDTLEEVLPKDRQVNEEAAKALVMVIPEVREAALTNPKLDSEWLGKSLEISLQDQGETMALLAPQVREFMQLDQAALEEKIHSLLVHWSSNIQQIRATRQSKILEAEQTIQGRGGTNRQTAEATDNSEISHSKQNITFS